MSRRHRASRPVYANAHQRAFEAAQKLRPDDARNLQAIVMAAFVAFRSGSECAMHWRTLADALNISEALSEIGICEDPESRARVAGGMSVLGAVIERQTVTGSWTLHAAEITAMDDAVWMHGIQVGLCSLGEYEQAVKRVAQRVRQALAGNASPGTKVVEVPCTTSKRESKP